MTTIKEQLLDILPENWQLLNIIQVPFGTDELGTHECVFYNKNLDLEARIYIKMRGEFVSSLHKLPSILNQATEEVCDEFVEALE